MLKQRVITAIILAITLLGTILFLGDLMVAVLFSLIMFIASLELVNMTVSREKWLQWVVALLMVALFFLVLPFMSIRILFYHSYSGIIIWLMILLFMFSYRYSGQWGIATRTLVLGLSLTLIWICINSLVFIHSHFSQGEWLLIYIFTLVWVADIGAYFAGKRFGRNKLAVGISPGKTREGVVGGLLLNGVWISIVYLISKGWGMSYFPFLMLGLVTAGLSVVGDLYESILKREAGIKDSGRILPGHGGVMDRVDSIIAATPVYISGLYLLGGV